MTAASTPPTLIQPVGTELQRTNERRCESSNLRCSSRKGKQTLCDRAINHLASSKSPKHNCGAAITARPTNHLASNKSPKHDCGAAITARPTMKMYVPVKAAVLAGAGTKCNLRRSICHRRRCCPLGAAQRLAIEQDQTE